MFFYLVYGSLTPERVDVMTLQQAYHILGVPRNSSFREVKKTFRTLSKKYHPDLYDKASEEKKKEAETKFKEISEAYTFLEKIENMNKTKDSQLLQLKEQTTELLNSFLFWDDSILSHEKYTWFYQKLEKLEKYINNSIHTIWNETSEVAIRSCLDDASFVIYTFYQDVLNEYLIQNSIPASYVQEDILDYDCNIRDFVLQLVRIQKDFENTFSEFRKAKQKYQLYVGYEVLKDKIDLVLEKYERVFRNENDRIEKILLKMNQEIEQLFACYFDQKKKYEQLIKIFTEYITVEEMKKISDLKSKIGSEQFYVDYETLKPMYFRQVYQDHKESINELYFYLHEKAGQEMRRLSVAINLNRVSIIQEIERFLLFFFDYAKQGILSYDQLLKLRDLTFYNFDFDFELLLELYPLLTLNDIYIQKEKKEEEEADQIRWVQKEHDWYYVYSWYPSLINEVQRVKYRNMEEILCEYIPLVTFLEKAIPIFDTTTMGECLYRVPEHAGYYYYCFLEDDYITIQLLDFKKISVLYREVFSDKSFYLKDKERLGKIILEQINSLYQDQRKRECNDILSRIRKKDTTDETVL